MPPARCVPLSGRLRRSAPTKCRERSVARLIPRRAKSRGPHPLNAENLKPHPSPPAAMTSPPSSGSVTNAPRANPSTSKLELGKPLAPAEPSHSYSGPGMAGGGGQGRACGPPVGVLVITALACRDRPCIQSPGDGSAYINPGRFRWRAPSNRHGKSSVATAVRPFSDY